jgi:hypothetical protein
VRGRITHTGVTLEPDSERQPDLTLNKRYQQLKSDSG